MSQTGIPTQTRTLQLIDLIILGADVVKSKNYVNCWFTLKPPPQKHNFITELAHHWADSVSKSGCPSAWNLSTPVTPKWRGMETSSQRGFSLNPNLSSDSKKIKQNKILQPFKPKKDKENKFDFQIKCWGKTKIMQPLKPRN